MTRVAAEADLQMLPPNEDDDDDGDASSSSNSLDYLDDDDDSDLSDMDESIGGDVVVPMRGDPLREGVAHAPAPPPDDAAAALQGGDVLLPRMDLARHELEQEQEQRRLNQQLVGANNNNDNVVNNNNNGLRSNVTGDIRKRKSRDEQMEDIEMTLSEEERRWAVELKAALMESEDDALSRIMSSLTDMEIAQHAITSNGDIKWALDRIVRVDVFRKQYGIEDTVEQGVESIQAFIEQSPGFLLSVDQCSRHAYYVQVVDFSNWHPKKIRLERDWKIFMRGMYYLQTAGNPTLSAVRAGILAIAECDGMGWDNFCIEFERRMWYEHIDSYPMKFHEISWVRPPLVANVVYSLLKPIIPDRVKRVFHLGVKFDDHYEGRLDELFLQPTIELANQRNVEMAKCFLVRRFTRQATFRL